MMFFCKEFHLQTFLLSATGLAWTCFFGPQTPTPSGPPDFGAWQRCALKQRLKQRFFFQRCEIKVTCGNFFNDESNESTVTCTDYFLLTLESKWKTHAICFEASRWQVKLPRVFPVTPSILPCETFLVVLILDILVISDLQKMPISSHVPVLSQFLLYLRALSFFDWT